MLLCVFNQTAAFFDLLTALQVVHHWGCWKHPAWVWTCAYRTVQNLIYKHVHFLTKLPDHSGHRWRNTQQRKLQSTPQSWHDPSVQQRENCLNSTLNFSRTKTESIKQTAYQHLRICGRFNTPQLLKCCCHFATQLAKIIECPPSQWHFNRALLIDK